MTASKISYLKTPLTIDEQINQMKKRGITFDSEKKAKLFLSNNNYYKFSYYYKKLAEDKSHTIYSENNSFDFYHTLYIQDREIGNLILKYISILEDALRAKFAYYFSINTKDSHPHLKKENFNCNEEAYNKLMDKLNGNFISSHLSYKDHYQNIYSEPLPPIWVLVECVPLGVLYECIKKTDSKYIQEFYDNFNYPNVLLKSFFSSLSFVRNLCAHNSIIWNLNNEKLPKLPQRDRETQPHVKIKESATLANINYEDKYQIVNFIIILYYLLQQLEIEHNIEKDFNMFFQKSNKKYLTGYGVLINNPLIK